MASLAIKSASLILLSSVLVRAQFPRSGFYANRNERKAVVVDGTWFVDPPGGVEALIQLSIALAKALPNSSHVYVTSNTYNEKWVRLYSNKLIRRVKSVESLQPGDVYIYNEGMECQVVPNGVNAFVWLLANYRGCKNGRYISHNQYLATFEGIKLPRERIVHPYLTPHIIERAYARSGLHLDGSISYRRSFLKETKENLVLIDDDCPYDLMDVMRTSAKLAGGRAVVLTEMNSTTILNAYESGKAVVDWCMRGSERCPLEASLYGNIAITGHCDTGLNFADFPVPSDFVISGKFKNYLKLTPSELAVVGVKLTAVFKRVFASYWDLVPLYEPLRRSVLSHNAHSMIKEAVDFLATVHIDERSSESNVFGGCIGC